MWKRALGALVLLGSIAILSYVWLGREKYSSLLKSEAQMSPVEQILTPTEETVEAIEEAVEAAEEVTEPQEESTTPPAQQ